MFDLQKPKIKTPNMNKAQMKVDNFNTMNKFL